MNPETKAQEAPPTAAVEPKAKRGRPPKARKSSANDVEFRFPGCDVRGKLTEYQLGGLTACLLLGVPQVKLATMFNIAESAVSRRHTELKQRGTLAPIPRAAINDTQEKRHRTENGEDSPTESE